MKTSSTKKKREGTIQPFKRTDGTMYYRARVALRDGFRQWVDVPEAKRFSESASAAFAAFVQEQEDLHGLLFAKRQAKIGAAAMPNVPELETVAEYAKRWLADREVRSITTAKDDRARLDRYVLPTIGQIPIRAVATDDLRRIVEALDARVRDTEARFSWKTATHVWGNVTKLFADACGSKRNDLRVRSDNPARDVAGPDRGGERVKKYLRPTHALTFWAYEDAPLELRRLHALSTMLYARPGEVAALEWSQVDWEAGRVTLHRSVDRVRERGRVKGTKTGKPRSVPIEPALLPLLEAMRDETGGEGRLFPTMPPASDLADVFRRHLRRALDGAEIAARDLFDSDQTQQQIQWYHATRSTGLTWCAVRGDDPLKIMRRAGHADFKTTMLYIREAEGIGPDFGDVFPTLPEALFGSKRLSRCLTEGGDPTYPRAAKQPSQCARQESNL